jgi:Protein phosphatase 2C
MWKVAGLSEIGTSHEASGKSCEDYWTMRMDGHRTVLAIADGAGSAARGAEGARIAADRLADIACSMAMPMTEFCASDLPLKWAAEIRRILSVHASIVGCELRDLASTALVCMLEGSSALFWQVGDGGWIVVKHGVCMLATESRPAEFVNQTDFVTSDSSELFVVTAHFENISSVMGFTDGVQGLLVEPVGRQLNAKVADKIAKFLSLSPDQSDAHEAIRQLLRNSGWRERSGDDLTLVTAWT